MGSLSDIQDLLHQLSLVPLYLEVTMITVMVGVVTLIVAGSAICWQLAKMAEALAGLRAQNTSYSNYQQPATGQHPGTTQYGPYTR